MGSTDKKTESTLMTADPSSINECITHKVDSEHRTEEEKYELLEKFERCSFCNSKLLFTHELNLSLFQVMESARCPGCGVTPKSKQFSLH